MLVGNPNSDFGRETFWAVREFQAYAAMAQVAQETTTCGAIYADRPIAVSSGAHRYSGPISGVVNAATRQT